ncbi:zinc-ribbon domain-containing protein [Luteolibacter arcticus]|uniref:Zinc-ribbon domain-containing protein n=1 Tax=Luteolibacter arcticus TaxID=1581411 RepID=A0ABT3GMY3_9BACT|nr:zinc-ribbon domain-containing protein [Luteolibacter arcticus]MCW1924874.1 zinc-ribbon domain-containing protein [Luteolibacter arcticus]
MTRRKSKKEAEAATRFREQRIEKLMRLGWIKDASEIPASAIPVDPDLVSFGSEWSPHPVFFRDQTFLCQDCGAVCVWAAADQCWYYETTKAPSCKVAVRCRECRRIERDRIREARRRAGHDPEGT